MTEIYKPHESDLWETPPEIFDSLNEVFRFEVDLAAEPSTAKCEKFYSVDDDAFSHQWNLSGFLNPPYRDKVYPLPMWLEKAAIDAAVCEVPIVCLVKAAVETIWFRTVWKHAQLILFFRKRIQFLLNGERRMGARFPNALAVFGPRPNLDVGWRLTELGFVIRAGRGAILLPEDL